MKDIQMKTRLAFLLVFSLGFTGCADVQLNPEELYTVELPANPSTGYQWRIQQGKVPACLEFLRKDYKSDEATEGLMGGGGVGGQAIFIFRAVEKGKGSLTFEYIREWEPARKPLQEKTYWVEVK
jgi:inhibitor of cysteine peptidase